MSTSSPRPRSPGNSGPLPKAHAAVASSLESVAGSLRSVLRRHGGTLATDTAIVSRIGKDLTAHMPVRLRRPLRVGELYERPHVVGAFATTCPLHQPVSDTALPAGTYAVRLRPVTRRSFAFDFLDARGARGLAAGAHVGAVSSDDLARRIRFLGIDIDIDELDDIIVPGQHVICISFLHWRTCFYFVRITR